MAVHDKERMLHHEDIKKQAEVHIETFVQYFWWQANSHSY